MLWDHQLSAKRVTVGSIHLKAWAFAEPPAYRERNLEICSLNDSVQGLGGLLVEPGCTGRTRAWFAQFPAGKKHYLLGIPVQVLGGLLSSLGLSANGVTGPDLLKIPMMQVPTLDCEFEELSLAKARRDRGMSPEYARELATSCAFGRRQALMVSRVTTEGLCDGNVMEGDVVLCIGGRPVTRPQDVERAMQQCQDATDGSVLWKVLRARNVVETRVCASSRYSDGTERLVVFNGLVLRPTLRAVAERGGPVLSHTRAGEGLYFWYVLPGSPANTFGLMAPGWLVQVNDEPTPSIKHLLEVVKSGKLRGCEWLRCHTMDSEGRPTVHALQPDPLFWPTMELSQMRDEDCRNIGTLRWVRAEYES